MTDDLVVLVDPSDRRTGTMAKMAAHREGALHRAVSVFVLNAHGELLLQKRASSKYHSGGLWSNTCCGHPRPGEASRQAAVRRLSDEMGIVCALAALGTVAYRVEVPPGLIENEIVHLFAGRSDLVPRLDPAEAEDWRWQALDQIATDMARDGASYTAWFKITFPEVKDRLLTSVLHSG